MNYNKIKTKPVVYTSKESASEKYERWSELPATDMQKSFMTFLKIKYPQNINKLEAYILLDKAHLP